MRSLSTYLTEAMRASSETEFSKVMKQILLPEKRIHRIVITDVYNNSFSLDAYTDQSTISLSYLYNGFYDMQLSGSWTSRGTTSYSGLTYADVKKLMKEYATDLSAETVVGMLDTPHHDMSVDDYIQKYSYAEPYQTKALTRLIRKDYSKTYADSLYSDEGPYYILIDEKTLQIVNRSFKYNTVLTAAKNHRVFVAEREEEDYLMYLQPE